MSAHERSRFMDNMRSGAITPEQLLERLIPDSCLLADDEVDAWRHDHILALTDSFVVPCATRAEVYRSVKAGRARSGYDRLIEVGVRDINGLRAHWTVYASVHAPYQRISVLRVAGLVSEVIKGLYLPMRVSPLICVLPESHALQWVVRHHLEAVSFSPPWFIATRRSVGNAWRDYDLDTSWAVVRRRRQDCSFLHAVKGPHAGRCWEIARGKALTLGRSKDAAVMLWNAATNEIEAVLAHRGARIELHPRAEGGIVVNGARILATGRRCDYHDARDCWYCAARAEGVAQSSEGLFVDHLDLEHGDRLQIGRTTFELEVGRLDPV